LHKQGKERAERELEEADLEISSLKKENKTQSQLIEELHDQIVQLKNNMKSQEENVAVCLKGQQEKLEKTLVELQECKTTAQEMRTRKVFLWFCHLFFKIVFFSNLSITCLNDLRRDFIVEAFATKHQSQYQKPILVYQHW
jgi:DNA repair exonuclease SbcCD ATPase subunit